MDRPGDAQHKGGMPGIGSPPLDLPPLPPWRAVPTARAVIETIAVAAAATAIAAALAGIAPTMAVGTIYLLSVLLVAVRHGFWCGIAGALLAFLACNFFLVEPLYTFDVADWSDVLALATLLVAGAITGALAGRLREQAEAAAARAHALVQLAEFGRDLAQARTAEDIARTMARHLAGIPGDEAVALRVVDGVPAPLAPEDPTPSLSGDDLAAAERAARRGTDEEATAPGWPGARFSFRPLDGGRLVVGFAPGRRAPHASAQDAQVRRTILDQGRLALERLRLAADADSARAEAEREALRAALLSSLSHDLNTPLATMLGSISTLRQLGDAMTPAARADLLAAAEEETRRLSRYVAALLQLTRLKSGPALRRDWIDVVDAAQGAVARARTTHPGREIRFAAAPGCPLLLGDAALLEQAVFNLVDNAVRYSPAVEPVDVRVTRAARAVVVHVADRGAGFTGRTEERSDADGSGGLGLAIVRAIAQAMGGRLETPETVANGRGSTMHLRIPIPARET